MGLIKSNHAPATLSAFSMNDIEKQARAILARAQQQADQLLAEAQREASQLKQRAHAEGLAEGHSEGLAAGRAEGQTSGHGQALAEHRKALTDAVKGLTGIMSQLDASRQELESTALREVVELAVAIAQRITRRQGMIDPQVLVENISDAMRLVVRAADVRIAVNPCQKAVLTDALPRLQLQWPALEHVELIEDPALEPGGCRIYTRDGEIDGDLDRQLDRVIAELLPVSD